MLLLWGANTGIHAINTAEVLNDKLMDGTYYSSEQEDKQLGQYLMFATHRRLESTSSISVVDSLTDVRLHLR